MKLTFLSLIFCLLSNLIVNAQSNLADINGDGALKILILGTNTSIQDNHAAFSPNQIATELQNILSLDTQINMSIHVIAEDVYRTKNVVTGIANQFTSNLDYYCHSLTQYYFWPENRMDRLANLKGNAAHNWDYVVINEDPFLISTMPGFYSLGVNKIAKIVHEGGAVPLLLMEWSKDESSIQHFKEFTYRTAEGATVPIRVVPAGLAWKSLPSNLKDSSIIHPTPNGAYLSAASIYSNLYNRSAANSQYIFNDAIADSAESTRTNALNQTHFTGLPTFESPYKSCEVADINLKYNHGGTSTENGFLSGLNWIVAQNQKTLQFSANPPIHFNYGRSSMGSTHLYNVNPAMFDYTFGYPLQDDASNGRISMQYGIDKRANSIDVETDLGTARKMINQAQIPYARNVPLRTIISQMIEEIPGILIYPIGDPWHLSSDVNKAIATFMHTILTSDCTIEPSSTICLDSTQWRTWMAHKIGQETAWNLMYLKGANSCNKHVDVVSACNSYTWMNGTTYTASNSGATHALSNMQGCDSLILLNLTINHSNTSVSNTGVALTADQSGVQYQWINCTTGNIVVGANAQTFTPSNGNEYAVIVTDNGCSDTSLCYSVASASINFENAFERKIQIYPNPTEENISIDLGGQFDNVNVVIRNILGQEVFNGNYASTNLIETKLVKIAGIYIVTINTGDKKASVKLIVK